MPAQDWPTTTLIAFVHQQLLAQPNVRGYWRATVITTALSRLAERGVPADCLIRTCIGPALVRRILLTTSSLWFAFRSGDQKREDIPELEGWFELLDREFADLDDQATWNYVATISMKGVTRESADAWIADASITHILSWRRDDYLRVSPSPDSLVLACGTSGTRWIYERSVLTYSAEWHPDSRAWEAAYLGDATAVAELVGLPVSLLAERTVTHDSLFKAQLEVVSGAAEGLVADMNAAEVLETVVSFVESQMLPAALDLAKRAHRAWPSDEHFQLVYAFCLIPFDISEAERILDGFADNFANSTVAQLDRATVKLMRGYVAEAIQIAEDIEEDERDEPAWLWEPESLRGEPRVMYGSAREWVARLRSLSPYELPSSAVPGATR